MKSKETDIVEQKFCYDSAFDEFVYKFIDDDYLTQEHKDFLFNFGTAIIDNLNIDMVSRIGNWKQVALPSIPSIASYGASFDAEYTYTLSSYQYTSKKYFASHALSNFDLMTPKLLTDGSFVNHVVRSITDGMHSQFITYLMEKTEEIYKPLHLSPRDVMEAQMINFNAQFSSIRHDLHHRNSAIRLYNTIMHLLTSRNIAHGFVIMGSMGIDAFYTIANRLNSATSFRDVPSNGRSGLEPAYEFYPNGGGPRILLVRNNVAQSKDTIIVGPLALTNGKFSTTDLLMTAIKLDYKWTPDGLTLGLGAVSGTNQGFVHHYGKADINYNF